MALRRQLRNRTVKAGTDCWDNGYLKRSRRDDHRLGDYVPAIIDLRDEPLISPTFELNHAISGEDGQVEMAGIGFEIVRKLISRGIALRIAVERKTGQRTKCARGKQGQGIVATAPTVADAGMAIYDQV